VYLLRRCGARREVRWGEAEHFPSRLRPRPPAIPALSYIRHNST